MGHPMSRRFLALSTLFPISLCATLGVSFDGARAHPGPPEGEAYRAMAAYSEAHAGHLLLVMEGQRVAFEVGQNGHDARRPHALYSGTKSFMCPLVMAGVEDGLWGLESPAGPTFGAGESPVPVRVVELLQMTSGLDDQTWWNTVDGAPRGTKRPEDRYAFGANLPVLSAPGRAFQYSSAHWAALGAFLGRAVKVGDYLERKVLRPIGAKLASWAKDDREQPILAYGMSMRARDFARLGQLVRDDGRVVDRRGAARAVLPRGRLARCFSGSRAMPAYGLGWWLNVDLPAETRAAIPAAIRDHLEPTGPLFGPGAGDLVAALGSNDQRLYVIPSRDLVIVRFGGGDEAFRDAELLAPLLAR